MSDNTSVTLCVLMGAILLGGATKCAYDDMERVDSLHESAQEREAEARDKCIDEKSIWMQGACIPIRCPP